MHNIKNAEKINGKPVIFMNFYWKKSLYFGQNRAYNKIKERYVERGVDLNAKLY